MPAKWTAGPRVQDSPITSTPFLPNPSGSAPVVETCWIRWDHDAHGRIEARGHYQPTNRAHQEPDDRQDEPRH